MERRRRLLREDRSSRDPDTTTSRRTEAKTPGMEGRAYSEVALADVETRITDFIPTRRWVLFAYLLAGLASVAAVIGTYLGRNYAMKWLPEEALASFRLQGVGTIACWLGSMMLMAAAVVCLAIYRIRRHKTDDYRGRYRLWLWAWALCVLASLDAVTSWHRLLQIVMIKVADTHLWRDGSVWWIGLFALVGLVTSIRLLLDMRRSLGSVFCALISVGLYAFAAVLHFGLVDLADFDTNKIAHAGSLLLGHGMLLYSLLVFARFVHLAAAGEIVVKKRTSKSTADKPRRGLTRRRSSQENEKAGAPSQLARNSTAAKKPAAIASFDPDDDDDVDLPDDVDEMDIMTDPNLSKAERRRLRKQLKRSNRRAA